MNIKKIKAIRVFDSRGIPTLKTFVYTNHHITGASVPSGTSAGNKEAVELRDNTKALFGKDVTKAIKNVNNIIGPRLEGEFLLDQTRIDNLMIELDGTNNKSRLGSNAILSVSEAVCRAASKEIEIPLYQYIARLNNKKTHQKTPFPKPLLNIINGGEHAGSDLAFQEFQILPKKKKISDNIMLSAEIYLQLKEIISKKYGASSINVGYEGGFAPNITDPKIALDLIEKAIKKAGCSKEVSLGLDCAANSFYNPKSKKYFINTKYYSSSQLLEYYANLLKNYKQLKSIEDPFYEEDKNSWKEFTKKYSSKINIIGDDLLVTNPKLIKEGIQKKYCNSLLLKPNQIGTITESIKAFNLAKANDWKVIVSHRSGETEDAFISDFAFGVFSDYVKFGAPARSDRNAKYNRLLEIEEVFLER